MAHGRLSATAAPEGPARILDAALDLSAHAHGLVMLQRAGRLGERGETMGRFFRRSLARVL